MKPFDIQ